MSIPTDPMELYEELAATALDMLKVVFLESDKAWPEGKDESIIASLFVPLLGVGIATTTEYFANHPEMLALVGQPICTACRSAIETLQVGVDPARDDSTVVVKVAWPCGHTQS